MCLPCWPVKDIYLEDDPPHQSVRYAWDGGKWVETTRPSRISYQHGMASAPVVMQPMMTSGAQPAAYYGHGQHAQYMHPAQFANSQNPVFVGHSGVPPPQGPPDIMGIGKTGAEAWYEQCYNAQTEGNQMNEPQDFKPADPDPSRMYPCREADGAWTQRNLVTIERLDDARWYIDSHGRFYAVRSAD